MGACGRRLELGHCQCHHMATIRTSREMLENLSPLALRERPFREAGQQVGVGVFT
jgi:hypothetical protein